MNKPFIKLLDYEKGYYFYDVNRNEMVNVSQETYNYLNNLLNDDVNDIDNINLENIINEISSLQENGYLSDNKVEVIEHYMSEDLEDLYQRKLSSITLQITQNCNLNCKYCLYSEDSIGQRHHSNKKITIDICKKSVDYLKDHSIDSDKLFIGFYGGEPLLEMELITQTVEYSKKIFLGKEIEYSLTTNATLLTKEIVQFFNNNNFNILISLDGIKKIHDKNRVFRNGSGSFDIVINNLKMIEKEAPEFFNRIKFNMVIDTENDFDDIVKIYDFDPIFRKVEVKVNFTDDSFKQEKIKVNENFKNKYLDEKKNTYLSILRKNKDYKLIPFVMNFIMEEIQNAEKILTNPTFKLPKKTCPSGPCTPGLSRMLIDVEGNLFPCERIDETSKANILGSLENGIDIKKAYEMLNIAQKNEDKCRNCWAFNLCTICIKHCNEEDLTIKEKSCENCKETAESRLKEYLYYINMSTEEMEDSYEK